MGIQINGNNDIISALDGSWTAEGASINTSGILTATTFKGNIVGTAATFTGPVTIGGTLTYEDVTNIDSVGIVTARSGLKVTSGQLDVGSNIKLGNAGVVTATSFVGGLPITSGANNRIITASSASAIQGESNLTFNGSALTVAGSIACDTNTDIDMSATSAGQLKIGGDGYTSAIALNDEGMQIYHNSASRAIIFGTNETERLRIKSDGNIIPGTNNATNIGDGTTNFNSIWASTRFRGNDNVKLILGNSQNLVIRHDGSYNIIGSPVADDLHIKSGTGDNDNQLIAAFVHSTSRVGIGLTNPDQLLHIASTGTAKFKLTDKRTSISDGSQYGVIQFEQRDSNTPGVSLEMAAVMQDTTNGATALQIKTGTPSTITERLRIDSHGCLRVGNTHNQSTSSNTKRIALGGKAGIWGWVSGQIDGALTLADNYYWDGANNRAIEAAHAAYLSLRLGTLRFGTTNSVPSAGGVTGLTEKFRITSSGDVLIGGHSSPIEPDSYASHLEVHGTSTDAGISILRYSNDTASPTLLFGKSRGTSIGVIGEVQSGDSLGKIEFYGTDTGWESSASIRASADGEWYSGSSGSEDNTDAPGRLEFHTTPNGADNLQERLRITSTGQISIDSRSSAGTVLGNARLSILPESRTSAFSASDGDTWHDVVLHQGGSATNNAVGLAFQLKNDGSYHKNAGTGIAAVKNGTNSDYGADLVFITRPQSAVAEERLRIESNGDVAINTNDGDFGQSNAASNFAKGDPKLGVHGSIAIMNTSSTTTDFSQLAFYRRTAATPQGNGSHRITSTHNLGKISWNGSSNDTSFPDEVCVIQAVANGGDWWSGSNRRASLQFHNNNVGEMARFGSNGIFSGMAIMNRNTSGVSGGGWTTHGAWKVLVDLNVHPSNALYMCDAAMQNLGAYTATFWVYKSDNAHYCIVYEETSLCSFRLNGTQIEIRQNSGADQTNTSGYQKVFCALGMDTPKS